MRTESLKLFGECPVKPRPRWYTCPKCGCTTESEVKLKTIRCMCGRWFPAEEDERHER